MPLGFRVKSGSHSRAALALALVLVAGCGTQDASPANPIAPTTPGKGAPPAPQPNGVTKDLQDIKKDVAPPVIIKPGQPSLPVTQPVKAG
jgi:hypothetical protein